MSGLHGNTGDCKYSTNNSMACLSSEGISYGTWLISPFCFPTFIGSCNPLNAEISNELFFKQETENRKAVINAESTPVRCKRDQHRGGRRCRCKRWWRLIASWIWSPAQRSNRLTEILCPPACWDSKGAQHPHKIFDFVGFIHDFPSFPDTPYTPLAWPKP